MRANGQKRLNDWQQRYRFGPVDFEMPKKYLSEGGLAGICKYGNRVQTCAGFEITILNTFCIKLENIVTQENGEIIGRGINAGRAHFWGAGERRPLPTKENQAVS